MSNENERPLQLASPRPSRLGKASLILGLISLAIIILCGCVSPCVFLLPGDYKEVPFEYLFFAVAPLGFLASSVGSLIGICLAIAGLFRRNCRRRTSVFGLVLNVVALSVFVLMFLWWSAAIDDMIACARFVRRAEHVASTHSKPLRNFS
jgi:hypothetical protein